MGYTATASPGGATCSTSTTSCTLSGLTAGTSYTVNVLTRTSAGDGPAGSGAATTLVADPPTGVVGVAGDGHVVVSWSAPSDTGGTTIAGYLVESSRDGVSWETEIADTGSATLRAEYQIALGHRAATVAEDAFASPERAGVRP